VFAIAHELFGETRPPQGDGSEYDFFGGPLAAAVFAFREFDTLSYDVVPAVRSTRSEVSTSNGASALTYPATPVATIGR
jgi:hypothetical protein